MCLYAYLHRISNVHIFECTRMYRLIGIYPRFFTSQDTMHRDTTMSGGWTMCVCDRAIKRKENVEKPTVTMCLHVDKDAAQWEGERESNGARERESEKEEAKECESARERVLAKQRGHGRKSTCIYYIHAWANEKKRWRIHLKYVFVRRQ